MSRTSRALIALCLTLPLAAPGAARGQDRPVLELSLEETVKRALESNVDIAVERYGPDSAAESVREVQGFYDPLFFSTVSRNSRTDPARNVFAGAQKVNTDTTTFDFGLSQAVKTGASLRLDFTNSKQDTNSIFTTFNPRFDSSLNLNLTQPLLKNLKIDQTRQQLRLAKKNREISDVQFRQIVINTLANVKAQYYNLVGAIDNLEVQKKSLSLAQKLLEENRIKVRVGTMAPLDIVQAEAEVAAREENVIVAQQLLFDTEDALKRSVFAKSSPEDWDLRIVPTDRPTAEPFALDVPAALKNALENRTDIVAARKSLESAGISAQFAKNQTLPALDLVAAYGTTGIGGTQIEREGLGGPIINTVPGGYGDAVSDVVGRDFPTWTLGVNLSYPILNRQAKASSTRARLAREQAEANLRKLELQIATEVRSAARAVETNLKRVAATRAARVLSERRLDAEEKKFAAGMSTTFLVTQAQRDLAQAQVNELSAIADYRKSVVSFERVQEAGGVSSGAGGSLIVSTSSTSLSTATGGSAGSQSTGQQF